jgi:Mitochondrial degradasome RNA helicase subunit C terminal
MVCQSPIYSERDETTLDIVRRFAAKKAVGQSSGLTQNMIPKPPKSFGDLARLCSIFNEIELFLWLQRKFPPGNMIEQQAASVLRERAIEYISDGLNNVCGLLFPFLL